MTNVLESAGFGPTVCLNRTGDGNRVNEPPRPIINISRDVFPNEPANHVAFTPRSPTSLDPLSSSRSPFGCSVERLRQISNEIVAFVAGYLAQLAFDDAAKVLSEFLHDFKTGAKFVARFADYPDCEAPITVIQNQHGRLAFA